jgi:acyl carrier protein
MIPSALVTLNSLPLTPNGKVDRRALPDPDETALVSMPCHEPPHSGIEQTIAEIWAEVLGTRSIGRDSNFFDLGGHSLLLARVHVTLEARLQKEFDMIHLFRFPTVSSLAAHLSEPVDSSEFKLSRRRGSRRAAAVASRTSAAQA